MGVKRKPTALKIVQGTYRADKQGDPEQEPKGAALASVPKPPKSLKGCGVEKWHAIGEMLLAQGILEDRFLDVVEQACIAFQEAEAMAAVIEKEGWFVESMRTGFKLKHPAVDVRNKSLDVFRRCLLELGFTPASAATVRVAGAKKANSGIMRRERKVE